MNTNKKCSEASHYGSVRLFFHLLACSYCRRTNDELNSLLRELAHESAYKSDLSDDGIFDKAVFAYTRANPKSISEWIWNLSGLLIISCSVLFSFSSHYNGMKLVLGEYFQILVSLMLGVLVSVFLSFYMITHYKKIARFNDYIKALRKMHI